MLNSSQIRILALGTLVGLLPVSAMYSERNRVTRLSDKYSGRLYNSIRMDKQIKKKKWTIKRLATYGGISVLVIFVAYQLIFADRRQKLKIEKDKITISTVGRGV